LEQTKFKHLFLGRFYRAVAIGMIFSKKNGRFFAKFHQ